MSEAPASRFPYERNADPMSNRMAGAAALCMVHRSLGLQATQAEVRPKVSRRDAQGNLVARPYLLALDALDRGLAAVAFQAREPLTVLRRCHEKSIRAILHHRLNVDLPESHFTVLVGVEEAHVILHDPHYGPGIRVLQSDLRKLWQPSPGAEVLGNVLIAIASARPSLVSCSVCRTAAAPVMGCPKCDKAIGLQPSAVLGCANPTCAARGWDRIFCPHCGIAWNGTAIETAEPAVAPAAPEMNPLLARMDPSNFASQVEDMCKLLAKSPLGADVAEALRTNMRIYKELYAVEVENEKKAPTDGVKTPVPPSTKPAAVAPAPAPKAMDRVDGWQLGMQLLRELGILTIEPPKKPTAPPPEEKPVLKPLSKKIPTKKLIIPKRGDDEYGSIKPE